MKKVLDSVLDYQIFFKCLQFSLIEFFTSFCSYHMLVREYSMSKGEPSDVPLS